MNDTAAHAADAADAQPSAAEAVGRSKPAATDRPAGANGKGNKKGNQKNPKRRETQDRRPAIKLEAAAGGANEDLNRRQRQRPSEQGRRDGVKSGREQARENMINFMPLASHPAEPVKLSLRTEYTQRLFHDHFGRAQISLYNLICYLPIRMRQSRVGAERSEQFLDGLEELIDGRIADVSKRLKADMARLQKVAKDNGVNAVETYSKDPQEVSLPKLTPQIADLMGLLTLFDQYNGYVDALWGDKFVKTSKREATINAYRNEIVTLIRHLMHLYHESKRLLEKGETNDFAKLLRQKVDASMLPETLDGPEEAAARALTGGEPAPAAIAA